MSSSSESLHESEIYSDTESSTDEDGDFAAGLLNGTAYRRPSRRNARPYDTQSTLGAYFGCRGNYKGNHTIGYIRDVS